MVKNFLSRIIWLWSAPEIANSLQAIFQLSTCQAYPLFCSLIRRHSLLVSKPVTIGSGPIRLPALSNQSADLQGIRLSP